MTLTAPPNLSHLHSFAVFAERLNLTSAAEELCVSQPALHAQLKALAADMGGPLYHAAGRGLALTARGERLAREARDLLSRAALLRAKVSHEGAAPPLVLSTGAGACQHLLAEPLRAYIASAPAPLRLLTQPAPTTLAALRAGVAHVGFTRLPSEPLRDLAAEPLWRARHVAAVPSGDPLAARAALALQDLSGRALIVPPAHAPHRLLLSEALEEAGARWEVAVEAEGWSLMLHLAALGLGVAVVPDFCALPDGCVGVPLAGLAPQAYGLLYLHDPPHAAASAHLRALITARLAARRDLSAPPTPPRSPRQA